MITDTFDTDRIAKLSRHKANLNWSFVFFAVMYVVSIVTSASRTTPRNYTSPVTAAVGLATLGAYVWYAFAAGTAAKMLGSAAWKFVVWILFAPVAAIVLSVVLPATLGIVGGFLASIISTVVNASPLAIRFLLGGQLDSAIRDATTVRLA